ncbi:DUF924 domain-containing protein [Rhodobacteraceae bacterium RKSG542]|uniref:DUF924 family protein n=1 Tax=Pseudovibrio flavus TaxID=2529854 RepID=UPI0012BD00A1|nr:DUF924 family protein [Pseudovibrio flavus]MTI18390.1 DUF924 domain-containing protein [Pseudovibrio flavus]
MGSANISRSLDILSFWWAAGMQKWFMGGEAFDNEIREKFEADVEAAAAGEYDHWQESPHGTLALLILLDQFTRNIYRGTAKAFEQDKKAQQIALAALERKDHHAYPAMAKTFFFLPFEHAEDMDMQSLSCDLFRQYTDQDAYHYALVHMDVIRRFGRFPHRNKFLGRTSTPAEEEFLASGGFSA